MMQEVTNFARFYGMFNKVGYPGDKEELKRDMVRQITNGRTESLREVTRQEYDELCASLGRGLNGVDGQNGRSGLTNKWLRHHRSIALHQMQRMGVDTSDWNRVDDLCQDPRIAGRVFRFLSVDELIAMTTKLRIIERKGGFRRFDDTGEIAKIVSMNK